MRDPYRASPEGRDEAPPSSEQGLGLGAFKSTHPRAGLVATALGLPFTVDLHEDGLCARGQLFTGKRPTCEIAFDAIDALHFDYETLLSVPPKVSIVTFDAERLALPNDLERIDVVLDALDRRVSIPIALRARAALAQGERLTFGPVVLELDGIRLRENAVPWSDLREVVGERDTLVFYAAPPWGRIGWVSLRELPHPRALLEALSLRTTIVKRGLAVDFARG